MNTCQISIDTVRQWSHDIPGVDPLLLHKLMHKACMPGDYFPLLDQLFEALKQTATLPLPDRIMKPKHAPRWLARNCHLFHDRARTIVEAWKRDRGIRFNTIDDWQFYQATPITSD
jgi:hypothetical protein